MNVFNVDLEACAGFQALTMYVDEHDFPTIKFKKGELILRQGEYIDKIYWISNGLFSISHTASNGKQFNFGLKSTDFNVFGEVEVFLNQPSLFDLSAQSDVVATVIPDTQFLNLLDTDASILKFVSLKIASHYRELSEYNLTRNLFPLLYCIAKDIYREREHGLRFDLQYHEAHRYGCSERSYIRELQKLVKKNLVIKDGHTIKIIDEDGLKDLIESYE